MKISPNIYCLGLEGLDMKNFKKIVKGDFYVEGIFNSDLEDEDYENDSEINSLKNLLSDNIKNTIDIVFSKEDIEMYDFFIANSINTIDDVSDNIDKFFGYYNDQNNGSVLCDMILAGINLHDGRIVLSDFFSKMSKINTEEEIIYTIGYIAIYAFLNN